MNDKDKYEEFENAMNEGRIERVHCLWALAEVKRLRKQNKLMVHYFRCMRDGGLTDEDWRTINEGIGEEEE